MPQEQSKPPLEAKSSLGNIPAPTGSLSRTVVRELNQVDYHELRSEGDSLSYYEGQAREVVFGDKSPLRRLLAAATVSVEKGKIPVRRTVSYELPPEKYPMRRDLDAVASSVLDEFERAAKEFYDKVLDEKVNPYEKKLRLQFRLPDPEIEPEAYQVYGTNFERRLVVLWGVEKTHGSSLPLIHHKALGLADPKARTVAGELRKKLIGWSQKQADVQELLAQTHEPLWRFVVTKVRNPGTSKEGFAYPAVRQGTRPAAASAPATLSAAAVIPADTTRPLTRLFPREMKQFYKACQDFYARAELKGCAPYERELRREFKLPDPAKSRASYLVLGSSLGPKLLVVLEGTDVPQDKWTWLTPYKPLGIPPAPAPTPEPEALEEKASSMLTVTEQLARKTFSYAKVGAVVGTAMALLIGACLLVWNRWIDHRPLQFVGKPLAAGEDSVVLQFNKPIDPASLVTDYTRSNKFVNFTLSLSNEVRNVPVPLATAALDKEDPRRVTLTAATNLADGMVYLISLEGLRDTTLLRNSNKFTKVDFEFLDKRQVSILRLSETNEQRWAIGGDGEDNRNLRIDFNKQLSPPSLEAAASFSVDKGKLVPETARGEEGGRAIILTFQREFRIGEKYTLNLVAPLMDVTKSGNRTKSPEAFDFVFTDPFPPKLRPPVVAREAEGEAKGDPNRVFILFNENLDPSTVTNVANYSIMDGDREVKVHLARLASEGTNQNPRKIELVTDALHSDAGYQLRVQGVGDLNGNRIAKPVVTRFPYSGKANTDGPGLESLRYVPGTSKLLVDLRGANRLRLNPVLTASPFELVVTPLGSQQQVNWTAQIESIGELIKAPGRYPEGIVTVALNLKQKLPSGQCVVKATGLVDVWGITNGFPSVSKELRISGSAVKFQIEVRDLKGPNLIEFQTNLPLDLSEFTGLGGRALAAQKFAFDSPGLQKISAVEVKPGSNPNRILVQVDQPMRLESISGSCQGLRVQGWAEGLQTGKETFVSPTVQGAK